MYNKKGILLLQGLLLLLITQSLVSICYIRAQVLANYQKHRNYECIFLLNEVKDMRFDEEQDEAQEDEKEQEEQSINEELEKVQQHINQKDYHHHIYEFIRSNDLVQVKKDDELYFEVTLDSESKSILTYRYL